MSKRQDSLKHNKNNTVKTPEEEKLLLRRKRIIAVVFFVITVAFFLWLGTFLTKTILSSANSEDGVLSAAYNFKELINSYGSWGFIVAFGIQVLQVVVSPIPGEVVEIGMGLCFGWFWGSVICLLGGALAAWIILLFVRKYGVRFVELFISTEKINELRFINSETKLRRAAFWLYLIPGTPKDPLIFFFGLTKIKILDFILIQTVARIPSVVTSAIAGEQATKQNFLVSIIIFAVMGVLALIGMLSYRKLLEHRNEKKENSK